MRTRKDGGCSLCRASDENVGKKRCCHVLDNAAIAVRQEKGINYIDITGKFDKNDAEFSIKANQEKIKSFISSLSMLKIVLKESLMLLKTPQKILKIML